jgi:predicted metalloendopeptidase
MEIKVIRAYGAYLCDAFTDRMFEANKAISGVQEQEPRWKRAVDVINSHLGETVGKLYVAEYFPETSKQRVYHDERTKVLADWFSKQEAVPGLFVNGEKTLGENIGDNGGLQMAYRAFLNRMKQEPLNTIDGFTPAQRFYLAYARVWASNATPEYTAYLVNSDVHSPSKFRVNAALPMIDSWYDAFNIQPTDKMFIPKEKRALVW